MKRLFRVRLLTCESSYINVFASCRQMKTSVLKPLARLTPFLVMTGLYIAWLLPPLVPTPPANRAPTHEASLEVRVSVCVCVSEASASNARR